MTLGIKGVDNMNMRMPWEQDCGPTFASATAEGYLLTVEFLKNKRS